ncbi:OSTA/TMEM184 family protein [archaeon]|nr:MAG: OSTA/TMEM184 family protein [archaeon]
MSKVDLLGTIRSIWDWLIRRESEVLRNADWIESTEAKYTTLVLATLSLIFSFTHVFRHLKQYTMPEIQVYVIRIILTCPIYAITSSIAMFVGPYALYAETFRDLFEAIVVYSFFNLILEVGGGETDLVYAIENDGLLKLPWPLCCLKAVPRNAR